VTLPDPDEWPVEGPVPDSVPDPSPDLLRLRAEATPAATALVDADSGERWSYSAVDERASDLAARLAALGSGGPGPVASDGVERVGLLLGTRVAFAPLYFAVQRRGSTAVPLNVALTTDTLRSQAERAALDCLVCDVDTEALAADIAPDGAPVTTVDEPRRDDVSPLGSEVAPLDSKAVESGEGSESEAETAPAEPAERSLDADRLVLFTSGTTGRPKGVRLTGRNLVASAVGSAERLGVAPGDRWLVCLPTYHMGGLAPLVRSTLYGTTAVIQREFDADATARMTDREVTGVSLVPTMLARLLDAGWSPPDSLRFVLLGGAPASEDLLNRALAAGVPVFPTYGLTETASQVATATPEDVASHPGTVGRPLRETEVSIRDADGDPVTARVDTAGDGAIETGETGETGELVVSGPTVTPGYLDDERTAAAFGPAGLHTGDVARRDAAGRLWIVGRVDDRIVTGGENVHPDSVADALREHPHVADAAVVGLPDPEWGERVGALVVPGSNSEGADSLTAESEGADSLTAESEGTDSLTAESEGTDSLTPESVREFARDSVAAFAVPKTIGFADRLPRTASGTVDREAVRARLADEE